MPSGPAHLHRKFGNDWVAWRYLQRRGFFHFCFVIAPPHCNYKPCKAENDAIDYLIQEWDWAWDRGMGPPRPPALSHLQRVVHSFADTLRMWDRYATGLQMWWYCVAKYELRRRWYVITGRRKLWEEGERIDFDG